jgi:hypothetical protein
MNALLLFLNVKVEKTIEIQRTHISTDIECHDKIKKTLNLIFTCKVYNIKVDVE